MSYAPDDEDADASLYATAYEDEQDEEELECAHCGRYMRIGDMSVCDTCRHWFCTTYGDCIQIFCECGRNYCYADGQRGKQCCKYSVSLS